MKTTFFDKVSKLDNEYSDIIDVLDYRYEPKKSAQHSNLELWWTWEDDMNLKLYRWIVSLGDNEKFTKYEKNQLGKYTPPKYTYPKHTQKKKQDTKNENEDDENNRQEKKKRRF